jgi:hypothetical protein
MVGRTFENATRATAPVAGVSAGLYTFPHGKHTLFITNTTGKSVYLGFNGTVPSATEYDFYALVNGGEILIPAEYTGIGLFDAIGIWVPADGNVDNLKVRGA